MSPRSENVAAICREDGLSRAYHSDQESSVLYRSKCEATLDILKDAIFTDFSGIRPQESAYRKRSLTHDDNPPQTKNPIAPTPANKSSSPNCHSSPDHNGLGLPKPTASISVALLAYRSAGLYSRSSEDLPLSRNAPPDIPSLRICLLTYIAASAALKRLSCVEPSSGKTAIPTLAEPCTT